LVAQSVNNPQIADSFAQSNMAFNYDTSGIAPTFTAVNAANAANASLYKTTSRTMETYSLSSNRYDMQANISRNVGAQDRGFGIKAGGRFSGTRQGVGYYGTTWSGLGYTLADVTNGSGICGYQCDTPIPMISGAPPTANSPNMPPAPRPPSTPRRTRGHLQDLGRHLGRLPAGPVAQRPPSGGRRCAP
jgi:hypothetical protein